MKLGVFIYLCTLFLIQIISFVGVRKEKHSVNFWIGASVFMAWTLLTLVMTWRIMSGT